MFLIGIKLLRGLIMNNSTRTLSTFPRVNVSTEPSMFDEDIHLSLTVFDEEKRSLEECRSTKNSKSIVSTLINRWFLAPGVRRIPVRENGVVGTLFLPPGKGPFPGLINLFGGFPGLLEYKSALHASHGFASLALAYVGLDGLPSTVFTELDLEYFEKAINFMKENKHIQGEKDIGVVAICKGAVLAFAMATYLKGIRCVVSVNGAPFSIAGTLKYKDKHWDTDALDYSKLAKNQDNNLSDYITHPEEIAIEEHSNFFFFHKQHHVSYLLVTSLDDKCVSPVFLHDIRRLLEEEQHPDYEIHAYEDAGHLIEPPNFPFGYSFFQAVGPNNVYLAGGGKLTPHCKAQRDCWTKVFKFLNKQMSDHQTKSNL